MLNSFFLGGGSIYDNMVEEWGGGVKDGQSLQKLSLETLWAKFVEVRCSLELLPLIGAEDWCRFPVSFLGSKWQISTSELMIRLLKCPCI